MVQELTSITEKKLEFLMGLRARLWGTQKKQKQIARIIGKSPSLVSHVLSGRKTSQPCIEALQLFLKKHSKKARGK